jgi:hypothetical protein
MARSRLCLSTPAARPRVRGREAAAFQELQASELRSFGWSRSGWPGGRLHVRVACLLAQIDESLWFWEPDLLDAAAGIDWERDTRYESRLVRG